jgi:DNA-binding NtrC family response regulator
MADILIVDDDEEICAAFRQFLGEIGHTPHVASNALGALDLMEKHRPKLVIMDIRMPGMDGLEVLPRLREIAPDTPVVIMTAHGSSQTSIEAIRLGAFEYLTKPLDLDVVRPLIDRALDSQRLSRDADLRDEALDPEEEESTRRAAVTLVGSSPPMQAVYKRIGLLASNDAPVLVTGEKGVGKKRVARTIHFNSERKDDPLIYAAARQHSEEALEDKIFHKQRPDAQARATILLEDVDVLSANLQAKLLALLQDHSALGAKPLAGTRVIATTTKTLSDEVEEGRFSAELSEALQVLPLRLPPLQERLEDLPELISFFIRECNEEFATAIRGIDPDAEAELATQSWPGNIAQLQIVTKRACLLARGEVLTPHDLHEAQTEAANQPLTASSTSLKEAVREALAQQLDDSDAADRAPFHEIVAQVEAALIQEALQRTSSNQVQSAKLLALNRATLRKKILLYGL